MPRSICRASNTPTIFGCFLTSGASRKTSIAIRPDAALGARRFDQETADAPLIGPRTSKRGVARAESAHDSLATMNVRARAARSCAPSLPRPTPTARAIRWRWSCGWRRRPDRSYFDRSNAAACVRRRRFRPYPFDGVRLNGQCSGALRRSATESTQRLSPQGIYCSCCAVWP